MAARPPGLVIPAGSPPVEPAKLSNLPPTLVSTTPSKIWTSNPPVLDDFKTLVHSSKPIHYPLFLIATSRISIYKLPGFSSLTTDQRSALQDEWYHVLASGPGVFIIKQLFKHIALIDKVNSAFASIILEEQRISGKSDDHFAGSGVNDRIWNSSSKHCIQGSESFLKYYSNPWLPLICSAWLGPKHRLTAQVNVSTGMASSGEQNLLVKGLEGGWTKEQMLDELQKMKNDLSAQPRAIKQRSV
ncbi:hypothetical protein J1614_000857 [Plenodomus biglobosus]|nr:hypothetical protein J1614_000857 [Plenodomus biglobosus]